MTQLFSPLTLPNGTVLSNRIAKAAMEEHLGGPGQLPDHYIAEAYRAWGAGGSGLLITDNVMVDARALTSPRGVVLDRFATSLPSVNGPVRPRAGVQQYRCSSATLAGRCTRTCPA